MKLARLAAAATLAATTLLAQVPAHAVGRLIDVDVIDRDSGTRLPVYHHNGEWWVAGRPGARYAVQIRNASSERLMGVMSVDGVNVVTGDTASWDQSGYVLSRYQNAQITGWRKNEAEVAAFHFTALPRSYAARTGRPDNVGVIGVAVFRERYRPPVHPMPRYPGYPSTRESPAGAARSDEAAAPNGYPSDEVREASPQSKSAPASPRLGTGHGERETSYSGTTRFDRRSSQPDEVISIRYDSRDNLIAMGVIPAYGRPVPQRPDAFPESSDAGYVPDPPRWR
ncbi:hypothetical protein FVQ98_12750 [Ottowia sp. GY511]|uniref:Secreted protein n=1 Tax=Ottowia flava TaxID=2675430 RepID=A0ABW4KRL4_9BURK|nr:hypothetical protein [Ottowia sp. GY511]TXK26798.1 hypothetical protein FVQ98_12750 [Ottowia sp. GY511]